jgi:molybdopterin synthase catalytic subunit
MQREVIITSEPIDEASLLRSRELSSEAGAVITFLGVVRGSEAGQSIDAIEYEAFVPMAQHQFGLLLDQVVKRWPILSLRLIHRIGPVRAGEPSLWVEVRSGHRGEAFAACQFLIDEMKRVVPIWKKPMPQKVS